SRRSSRRRPPRSTRPSRALSSASPAIPAPLESGRSSSCRPKPRTSENYLSRPFRHESSFTTLGLSKQRSSTYDDHPCRPHGIFGSADQAFACSIHCFVKDSHLFLSQSRARSSSSHFFDI